MVARIRISFGWAYSSEPCHALARSMLGNSMMTVRLGMRLPSRTSVVPATRDVLSAVGVHGRLYKFAVLGEEFRVGDFDVGYYVGWHWGLLWTA